MNLRAGIILSFLVSASLFSQTLIKFNQDERWGYKNSDGNVVIPALFLAAGDFNSSGTAAVFTDSGWIFISSEGLTLYSLLDDPRGFPGLYRFLSDGRIGYVNGSGAVVIQPGYDLAYPFESGSAVVLKGGIDYSEPGSWVRIDTTGRVIHQLSNEESAEYSAAPVILNGRQIWINQKGERVK